MAKILKFTRPKKETKLTPSKDILISSSVDDLMLIIHHALHGTTEKCQPRDLSLASQLLEELASYVKSQNQSYDDSYITLSQTASIAVASRYPQLYQSQIEKGRC